MSRPLSYRPTRGKVTWVKVGQVLDQFIDSLTPRRRCLPWQHQWEEVLTDVPTCMRCHRRQCIPRDPYSFGE